MPTPDLAPSVLDLTRALVAIDSVSPSLVPGAAGEAEIAAYVANRLDAAGFTIRVIGPAARPSVVATRNGSKPGRTVVLNGHLDTVGVDGMDDPFTARLDGDRLFGRGTSDMKGGIAGLIVAAEQLAALDAPGRLAVVLVADEEDASLGATTVLDELGGDLGELRAADVCLIAEPTWLDLSVAHRGYEVVKVGISGRAAHSSQPEEGVDVMQPLGRLLSAIGARDAALKAAPSHPLLSNGSLMVTVARAGSAPFMVAGSAEVTVERRTLPGESGTVGLEEVRELIASIEADPRVSWATEPVISRSAWQADESGAAAELMLLLEDSLPVSGARRPARTGAPYWMESALWQQAGVPTVVCGPAGGGLHAVDEWVDVAQLQQFPVAVADAVGRFLAGK